MTSSNNGEFEFCSRHNRGNNIAPAVYLFFSSGCHIEKDQICDFLVKDSIGVYEEGPRVGV